MNSTALTHLSIDYVESDLREGQTLVQWRREYDDARRAQRRPRRSLHFSPRLRVAWCAS